MSRATSPLQKEYDTTVDEFLEERRETLEFLAEGDYAFSEYAQRLLDSIDGGDD